MGFFKKKITLRRAFQNQHFCKIVNGGMPVVSIEYLGSDKAFETWDEQYRVITKISDDGQTTSNIFKASDKFELVESEGKPV